MSEPSLRGYTAKGTQASAFWNIPGGWYYFSEPTIGEKGELKGNPLAKPMQRMEMLKLLENLRAMQPKKRKY